MSDLTDPARWRSALVAELAAIVEHGRTETARVAAAKLLAELMAKAEPAAPASDGIDEIGRRRESRRAS